MIFSFVWFAVGVIHAEVIDVFQVVRYERAGKWYVEPVGDRPRERVGIVEAAHRAIAAEVLGGVIHTGLPGGATFDRWVQTLRGEAAA